MPDPAQLGANGVAMMVVYILARAVYDLVQRKFRAEPPDGATAVAVALMQQDVNSIKTTLDAIRRGIHDIRDDLGVLTSKTAVHEYRLGELERRVLDVERAS